METRKQVEKMYKQYTLTYIGSFLLGAAVFCLLWVIAGKTYGEGWISRNFLVFSGTCVSSVLLIWLCIKQGTKNVVASMKKVMLQQCDPARLNEIAKVGIETGSKKTNPLSRKLLFHFETEYITSLNALHFFDEALEYWEKKWITKKETQMYILIAQIKMNRAFYANDPDDYMEHYEELPGMVRKSTIFQSQIKRLHGEYVAAAAMLKNMKPVNEFQKVNIFLGVGTCYYHLEEYDDARSPL